VISRPACPPRSRSSEEAAWKWILDAAGQLRSAFTSWRALGENYTIGRGFWGSSDGAELYQRTMEVLLDPANATSPWNQVPWPGGTSTRWSRR